MLTRVGVYKEGEVTQRLGLRLDHVAMSKMGLKLVNDNWVSTKDEK